MIRRQSWRSCSGKDEETAAAPPAEEEEIPALPAPEEANRAADAVVASRAASPAPAVIGNGNGTPKGNPKGTPVACLA